MKTQRTLLYGLAICSFAAGCVPLEDGESTGESQSALDVNNTFSLTKKALNLSGVVDEHLRQNDTIHYYGTAQVVRLDTNVTTTIAAGLPNLPEFIKAYGFGVAGNNEQKAFYYNRGDLGIGREMHCLDRLVTNGQIACYVKNFAAGDANSEFTFGFSNSIAFTNMAASTPFATVAMVYRQSAPPENRVVFMVYQYKVDPVTQVLHQDLQNFAALDRDGQLFANAFNANHSLTGLGVPGQNFNNHIPSNCVSCHGGQQYDASRSSETGSLFLPFDLDRFDFSTAAGQTQAQQLTAFKRMNEMVWKVAAVSGSDVTSTSSTPLRNQLDSWYGNFTTHQPDPRNEVFEKEFTAGAVPPGWGGSAGAAAIYQTVIGPSCRGCHMANMGLAFETEIGFRTPQQLPLIVNDLCGFAMPHSLQTVRQFWQSSQPIALESYVRFFNPTLADKLHGCGPGNVATLDPHEVISAL